MITIKLSLPGFEAADISQFIGRTDNSVRDCVFFINRDDVRTADYWFCLEAPYKPIETCHIQKKNVFFLTAEVAWPRFFYDGELRKNFLAQFARVYTCHDIYADNVFFGLPYLPWMINANHGQSIFSAHDRDRNFFEELTFLPKKKTLSVFCSNQIWTEEHQLRLKFVKALKAHFGDQIDWFGNGVQTLEQKWEGISPYKYHIAIENQSRNDVITEKLYDAFLGLAYPIYYGAPNASEYFDSKSFSTIDIVDLKGSIKKIEKIIESDLYEKRLNAIIASKNLVLSKYNLFERIADICLVDQSTTLHADQGIKENVTLMAMNQFDVKQDLSGLMRKNKFSLILKRLLYYYPGHLLKKISTRLLQQYNK
ncbi:glycosyltransferase family 10 domain-containing protein [Zwartia panacis]|uniref:glycosyltransferase family 10 domain-containing protein n=1 Tax=Zwartia panacis TaxID=2683345 RepID=UPI0025B2848B|nr:glycosyltransferase family 10 [Zwartia panacis]MDN4018444.1 glycosyltransferase family 10 [Zwartia panacis]